MEARCKGTLLRLHLPALMHRLRLARWSLRKAGCWCTLSRQRCRAVHVKTLPFVGFNCAEERRPTLQDHQLHSGSCKVTGSAMHGLHAVQRVADWDGTFL